MQHRLLAVVVFASCALGCAPSHKLRDFQELREMSDPITILARDSAVYHLKYFRLTDSVLVGTGTVERNGFQSIFEGDIPYRDARYIESRDISTVNSLLAVAAGAVFVGYAYAALAPTSGFQANVAKTYVPAPSPGGGGGGGTGYVGGSCPLLYSYDGTSYHFEAEASGGALARVLEYATIDDMRDLRESNGEYKLLLTQDAPESDHVNQLHLILADHKPGLRVLADTSNKLHTLGALIPPLLATHNRMGACTAALSAVDSNYWRSNISSNPLKTRSDLKDEIILRFARPSNAHQAKFVIYGRNTELIDYAFEVLMALAGKERLRWYSSLDHDSTAAAQVAEFVRREGGLHFEVLEKNGWREQGEFRDQGVRLDRWQLGMLDLSRVVGDTLSVRISSTADLWKLDFAGIDYSEDQMLSTTELEANSAITATDRNIAPLLEHSDNSYFDMFRGDSAFVVFKAPPVPEGMERSLFAYTKAYYHSWFYADAEEQPEFRQLVLSMPGLGIRTVLPVWKKAQQSGK